MSLLLGLVVFLLVLLAAYHLVVGVSNDAVNFLNSAMGSKAAKRKTILWVSSVGLLVGVFFSGGMMEVARSGVIHPEHFMLHELLIIFVGVILANILLLDAYNTIGFPTSTTLALVFGLLGGALAIMLGRSGTGDHYARLINADGIFLIFAGILISIFLAFLMGAAAQFLTRLVFSFRHTGRYRLLFALFGALAITTLLFMVLKKGMGGIFFEENFMSIGALGSWTVLGASFVVAFSLLYGLAMLFHLDIPRLVVIFGTFALALSFAANDLVNFIGLPLTGIECLKVFSKTPEAVYDAFPLTFLTNDWIRAHYFTDWVYMSFFAAAALVMILTLFRSRKLQSVTETEVYLGRQTAGREHFEPSPLSRKMVRSFLNMYEKTTARLPRGVHHFVASRFEAPLATERPTLGNEVTSFDTVRASVNLVIASLLISLGTYLRFPLSTTFVVFMVAMGTSFADQAWGRESAVYRLAGVLSILGGWFITACAAFLGAFVFSLALFYGGWPVAVVLTAAVVVVIWRTGRYHREKVRRDKLRHESFRHEKMEGIGWLRETGREKIRKHLLEISKIYFMLMNGLIKEDHKQVREAMDKSGDLQEALKSYKTELFRAYSKLPAEVQDTGHLFVQALDYLSELANTLVIIGPPIFRHLDNQHRGLTTAQQQDLNTVLEELSAFIHFLVHYEKEKRFDALGELKNKQSTLMQLLEDFRLDQIRRIRDGEGRTRVNVIYMEVLGESKNILLYGYNVFQSLRDFYLQTPAAPRT